MFLSYIMIKNKGITRRNKRNKCNKRTKRKRRGMTIHRRK